MALNLFSSGGIQPFGGGITSFAPTNGVSRPTIAPTRVGQTSARRASTLNAHTLKIQGLGSSMTQPRQSKVGDLGADLGGRIGGETGRTIGGVLGEILNTFRDDGGERPQVSSNGGSSLAANPCGTGMIRVGDSCLDPRAALPGGRPAVVPTSGTQVGHGGGTPVMGAFGLPAMQPRTETRIHRSCGPGMVLGKDDLCYPKGVLSRRSQYRKWRAAPRPPITSSDVRAIRKAARARDRVLDLAKDVGLHASKSRPKRGKK